MFYEGPSIDVQAAIVSIALGALSTLILRPHTSSLTQKELKELSRHLDTIFFDRDTKMLKPDDAELVRIFVRLSSFPALNDAIG